MGVIDVADRLSLQTELETILGSSNIYFQPPTSIRMKYPAIVYFRKEIENVFADDAVYNQHDSYTVVIIDKNPDSEIVRDVLKLPMCRYDRHYVSDNLNHDVCVLYY